MPYSEVSDLVVGGIALPSDGSPAKYVQDAADEIDSKLGFRYVTPIVMDEIPANRAGRLLLKRINNWLASGRLILALAAPREELQNNAYGLKLIEQAEAALEQLASGDIPLPGAPLLNSDETARSGPVISNLDAASNVEAFYGFVTQDPYAWPVCPPVIFPAGTNRTW